MGVEIQAYGLPSKVRWVRGECVISTLLETTRGDPYCYLVVVQTWRIFRTNYLDRLRDMGYSERLIEDSCSGLFCLFLGIR